MRRSGGCRTASSASSRTDRSGQVGAASLVSDVCRRVVGGFERRDEREFLPAALEVVETPASPTGRLLGLIIVLFFGVALAWEFLGRVDVIANAPGRIVPAGDIKRIQPL